MVSEAVPAESKIAQKPDILTRAKLKDATIAEITRFTYLTIA